MTRTLARLAIAALLLGGCSHASPPAVPAAPPPPSRTTTPPNPILSADPERDLGAGTPGAPCATSRLGKWFTRDGVTYVCKGPKPYRWRATEPS